MALGLHPLSFTLHGAGSYLAHPSKRPTCLVIHGLGVQTPSFKMDYSMLTLSAATAVLEAIVRSPNKGKTALLQEASQILAFFGVLKESTTIRGSLAIQHPQMKTYSGRGHRPCETRKRVECIRHQVVLTSERMRLAAQHAAARAASFFVCFCFVF